jgi:hypothetical protein
MYPINLLRAWLHGASQRSYNTDNTLEAYAVFCGREYAFNNDKLPYQL